MRQLQAAILALIIQGCATTTSMPDDIFTAVSQGNITAVEKMLKAGENPNQNNGMGHTPLHWVGDKPESAEIAQLLLDHGADPNLAPVPPGEAPLFFIDDNVDAASRLITAGADVNTRSGSSGHTPLHTVGSAEMARLLISSGADVNAQSSKTGNTPLHTNTKPEIIKALINSGADVNARNHEGETPLFGQTPPFATDKPVESMVLLARAGTDVNAARKDGNTLLHLGIPSEVARFLLAHGADKTIRNAAGKTPAEIVRKRIADLEKSLRKQKATMDKSGGKIDRQSLGGMFAGGINEEMRKGLHDDKVILALLTNRGRPEKDESLVPEAMKLVIDSNEGQFLSPYTSDGVTAEWVDKAINVKIGRSTGSAIGAAVGAYAASQLVDNNPLGSVVGGYVGSKAGKSVGREKAIEAFGGWEYIRETSDRSFASMEDMARYLVKHHGSASTFADVVEATEVLYPGLKEAVQNARQNPFNF